HLDAEKGFLDQILRLLARAPAQTQQTFEAAVVIHDPVHGTKMAQRWRICQMPPARGGAARAGYAPGSGSPASRRYTSKSMASTRPRPRTNRPSPYAIADRRSTCLR